MTLISLLLVSVTAAAKTDPEECTSNLEKVVLTEQLLTQAAGLETRVAVLESEAEGRKIREIQTLKAELQVYIDALLETTKDLPELEQELATLEARYQIFSNGEKISAPDTLSISELIEHPERLEADVFVKARPETHINEILFSASAYADFRMRPPIIQGRFLRAINAGIVGPSKQAGVVRWPVVHKNFVEVKLLGGEGGADRLLGCLKNGRLNLLRLITKQNDNNNLFRFKKLCD